jgi:hypothetical protein
VVVRIVRHNRPVGHRMYSYTCRVIFVAVTYCSAECRLPSSEFCCLSEGKYRYFEGVAVFIVSIFESCYVPMYQVWSNAAFCSNQQSP